MERTKASKEVKATSTRGLRVKVPSTMATSVEEVTATVEQRVDSAKEAVDSVEKAVSSVREAVGSVEGEAADSVIEGEVSA